MNLHQKSNKCAKNKKIYKVITLYYETSKVLKMIKEIPSKIGSFGGKVKANSREENKRALRCYECGANHHRRDYH